VGKTAFAYDKRTGMCFKEIVTAHMRQIVGVGGVHGKEKYNEKGVKKTLTAVDDDFS